MSFNWKQGGMGAAGGAASGAAAGTAVLPGWGTLIGGLGGALAGLFGGGLGGEEEPPPKINMKRQRLLPDETLAMAAQRYLSRM